MDTTPLSSALADRYRLERELGQGGMATVYLARDLKHDRDVAIKVLAASYSESQGAERFLREIRLAARLNHPHILPLFDSGEAAGLLWYSMPVVEGESLRDRLTRDLLLDVGEAVRIVTTVADALHYAHEQGIVHRDIKPENILLSSGHALVADFGIARLRQGSEDLTLTAPMLILGTPAYMSPEQVSDTAVVDGRSDVYSLGCVLYELLTGAPPFTGTSAQSVMIKHVTTAAAPPSRPDGAIADGIAAAVMRALAKEPAERFATAGEFAAAIRAQAPTTALPVPQATIVVLPFDNASAAAEDAFFATGLTDEIIGDLSKIRALRVTSRASSMQLRGTTRTPREIGRELNVRYALSGSVRRAGESLRVTAQLADLATDTTIWHERFDGRVSGAFDLQEELSRRIADAMRVQLTPEESSRLSERAHENVESLALVTRAREAFLSYNNAIVQEAKVALLEGLADDGDQPVVRAWLAMLYVHSSNVGNRYAIADVQRADRLATSALERDASVGTAYWAKGYAKLWGAGLRDAFRWLCEGNARERSAFTFVLGYFLAQTGVDHSTAIALCDELVARDPLTPSNYFFAALGRLFSGDKSGALALAGTLREKDWFLSEPLAAWVMLNAGEVKEARRLLHGRTMTPDMPVWLEGRMNAAQVLETGKVVAPSDAFAAYARQTDPAAAWSVAVGFALARERVGTLEWIRVAVRRGFTNVGFWRDPESIVAFLHGDPDFEALMEEAEAGRRAFASEWEAMTR